MGRTAKGYGISALARRFGLTRSALLHYDRIGLFAAADRSPSGYRIYSEDDACRLEVIRLYRDAGLPLSAIARLLKDDGAPALKDALTDHLRVLDRQAKDLRAQQERILRLLGAPNLPAPEPLVTAAALTSTLRVAGLDEADLDRLHALFERWAPAAHQAFLEALGLTAEAIADLRKRSRKAGRGAESR